MGEDRDVIPHMSMWWSRFARLENFFPNCDVLVFSYESYTRIREPIYLAEIGH
jgi:hypothetical protein